MGLLSVVRDNWPNLYREFDSRLWVGGSALEMEISERHSRVEQEGREKVD